MSDYDYDYAEERDEVNSEDENSDVDFGSDFDDNEYSTDPRGHISETLDFKDRSRMGGARRVELDDDLSTIAVGPGGVQTKLQKMQSFLGRGSHESAFRNFTSKIKVLIDTYSKKLGVESMKEDLVEAEIAKHFQRDILFLNTDLFYFSLSIYYYGLEHPSEKYNGFGSYTRVLDIIKEDFKNINVFSLYRYFVYISRAIGK